MHLADLALGDLEHGDPEEVQAFEEPGDILLVTGQTVEAVREVEERPPPNLIWLRGSS